MSTTFSKYIFTDNKGDKYLSAGGRGVPELSNLHDCVIPVHSLLNGWRVRMVFTVDEILELEHVFPKDATFGSAEAAYAAYDLARLIFKYSKAASLPTLANLTKLCTGGDWSSLVALEATGAKISAKLRRKAANNLSGAVVKAWVKHLVGSYKQKEKAYHRKVGTAIDFDKWIVIWGPIHLLKYDAKLNFELYQFFKEATNVCSGRFVELDYVLVHQKSTSWPLWAGGIRTTKSSYPAHIGEHYGHNLMGRLLNLCAVSLFGVSTMTWNPVERYKTNAQITALKEAIGVAKPSKRKVATTGSSGGSKKKKASRAVQPESAPVPAPIQFIPQTAVSPMTVESCAKFLGEKIRAWKQPLNNALDTASDNDGDYQWSKYMDPGMLQEVHHVRKQVLGPLVTHLLVHSDEFALEAAGGSERWTEMGLLETMQCPSDAKNPDELFKCFHAMARLFQ